MCQELVQLREAVEGCTRRFDARVLSSDDAAVALGHVTAIANMATTLKALVAARVAEGGGWRTEGDRSAAHQVAKATGSTVREAQDLLATGRRLGDQPDVADAARRGELSGRQASTITNAAAAHPDLAADLLAIAQTKDRTLGELKQQAEEAAADQEDLEARRARIHARRRLGAWTDSDGWHLHATGNPEDGAQIMAVLAHLTDQRFKAARAEGRREPFDAYAFDALVDLARHRATDSAGSGAGPAVKLLLRVDLDAFLRGFPVDGETCELVGYGPVAMSAVKDLLDLGNPLVAAILTRGTALVGVAHLRRRPTARQATALEWLYPSCAAEGCQSQAHLQTDHRIDWADTHFTLLDLLDRLCTHHHNLKTRSNWALVGGTGKRAFVAPTDSRHPAHVHAAAS